MQTQVTSLRWLSDFTQLRLGTKEILQYYLSNAESPAERRWSFPLNLQLKALKLH